VILPLLAALSLEWKAPESCPRAALEAQLDGLNGTATATAVEVPGGLHLAVQVAGLTRTLETRTCDEAIDAAALIIRLGLNAAEASAPPAVVEPAPVEVQAPEPLPAPPRSWSVLVNLTAGAGFAWLPQPVPRFGLGVTFQREALALMLDVVTSTPLRFGTGQNTSAGVEVFVPVDAQAGACWLWSPLSRLRVGPCAVGVVSVVTAGGYNVLHPRSGVVVVGGAGALGRAFISLTSWLDATVAAGARVTSHPQISFTDGPTLGASPVSLEAAAGIGARF
jgi:hypothetical protein